MRFDRSLTAVFVFLLGSIAWPQTPKPTYDPRVAFAPLTLPDPVNAYRSSNGAPGPAYWQNEADYEMHAALDTTAKVLHNDEVITYTNNSPDSLTSLWIHLEQNIYRKDARGHMVNGGPRRKKPGARQRGEPQRAHDRRVCAGLGRDRARQGIARRRITWWTTRGCRSGCLSRMAPKGSVLKIHIKYHYQIPGVWGGRTSWGTSKKGDIYDMAQWYPRMCVYDDLRGWDTLPISAASFIWNMATLTIT